MLFVHIQCLKLENKIISFRLEQHGTVIKTAVVDTIGKHNVKTPDLGGSASTTEFMKYVLEEIRMNTPEIGKWLLQNGLNLKRSRSN